MIRPTITWTLIANRSGAELLETRGPGTSPRRVWTLDRPAGRLRARELSSAPPGVATQRSEPGVRSMGQQVEPTEKMSQDFARQIAVLLERPRALGQFDRLVLVCPPEFLGRLRAELSPQTQGLVEAEVPKNLYGRPPDQVREQIGHEILI